MMDFLLSDSMVAVVPGSVWQNANNIGSTNHLTVFCGDFSFHSTSSSSIRHPRNSLWQFFVFGPPFIDFGQMRARRKHFIPSTSIMHRSHSTDNRRLSFHSPNSYPNDELFMAWLDEDELKCVVIEVKHRNSLSSSFNWIKFQDERGPNPTTIAISLFKSTGDKMEFEFNKKRLDELEFVFVLNCVKWRCCSWYSWCGAWDRITSEMWERARVVILFLAICPNTIFAKLRYQYYALRCVWVVRSSCFISIAFRFCLLRESPEYVYDIYAKRYNG